MTLFATTLRRLTVLLIISTCVVTACRTSSSIPAITSPSASRTAGPSSTPVDLGGLSKVELGFALALGATPRQLGAAVWVEGALVAGVGLIAGALSGWAVSITLVKVLSRVFDPAPSSLAVAWVYLQRWVRSPWPRRSPRQRSPSGWPQAPPPTCSVPSE